MNKKMICLALSAMMLICAGCASKANYDMATSESAAYDTGFAYTEEAMPAAEAPAEPQMASGESGVYSETSGAAEQAYGNHKIITTYSIEMQTDEFDKHLEQLQQRAAALGGYIQSSSVSGKKPETYNDGGRYANYSFRIPSDKAAEFVEFTKGTGVITYIDCNTEDVTLNYYDTETRLEVLRTQLDRLKSILVKTDNLADIIELEREIANVTLEIEQRTTELRKYDDLIDYTTIYVNLHENRLASAPADKLSMGERISRGFSENLNALGVFLENATVWFVCALPAIIVFALFAALIVLLIVWIRRGVRKLTEKSREKRAQRKSDKAARKAADAAQRAEAAKIKNGDDER